MNAIYLFQIVFIISIYSITSHNVTPSDNMNWQFVYLRKWYYKPIFVHYFDAFR